MDEEARSEGQTTAQKSAEDQDAGLYDAQERRATVAKARLAASSYVIVNAALLYAVGSPDQSVRGSFFEYLIVGLLIGISLSQAICLALWSSWGRGSHFARFLLLLATQAIFVFVCINITMTSDDRFFIYLIIIFGLMVAIVFPFAWMIRILLGMRIVHQSTDGLDSSQKLQFGILHIMGITVITSILLAMGRALAEYVNIEQLWINKDTLIFLFLMLASILIAIPVFTACLVDRHIGWVLPLAILSAFIIGAIEQPIYSRLALGPGPDRYHFLAINIVTFVNVLSFSIGMRLLGYRLTIGSSR